MASSTIRTGSAGGSPGGNGASREIAIGLVLGETYEIVRLLGEGGMGTVWEASHLRLPGKRCAVKVLHAQATTDQEAYARFRREAEIASRIGHPNIVEVLDWNVLADGTPYMVLEYLEGEDLAARLANGALPADQALAIARQIGAALKAAHTAQVVHRDLKPANVFLVPREVAGEMVDHVKVLDFGISKIRNSQTVQTQDAVLLGTPQYMAPEQALGKNHEIDARTDVFALASIVYEMIAGRPAFSGATLAEVVFKVVYEPVAPLSGVVAGVDPAISAAVERGMAKSPADRFDDVSSFITALTGRSLATTDRRAVRAAEGATVPRTVVTTPTVRSRASVFFVFAVLIGAAGTFAAVRFLGHAKPQIANPPEPKIDVKVAPEIAKPQPEIAPKVEHKVAPTQALPKEHGEPKRHVDAPVAAEPPEVKAMLDEAEAALQSGDAAKAKLIADRSLRAQKTSRGFAIITRAHCAGGDLGNAKATYTHVGASDRVRVRRDCKTHEIDLD